VAGIFDTAVFLDDGSDTLLKEMHQCGFQTQRIATRYVVRAVSVKHEHVEFSKDARLHTYHALDTKFAACWNYQSTTALPFRSLKALNIAPLVDNTSMAESGMATIVYHRLQKR
jgi:hypothetical protein